MKNSVHLNMLVMPTNEYYICVSTSLAVMIPKRQEQKPGLFPQEDRVSLASLHKFSSRLNTFVTIVVEESNLDKG